MVVSKFRPENISMVSMGPAGDDNKLGEMAYPFVTLRQRLLTSLLSMTLFAAAGFRIKEHFWERSLVYLSFNLG